MFENYNNKVKEMSLNNVKHAKICDSVELSYEESECIQGGLLRPRGMQHLHVEIPIGLHRSPSVGSNATPPPCSASDSPISRSSSLRTPSTPGRSLGLSPSPSSSSLVSTAQSKRRRIE